MELVVGLVEVAHTDLTEVTRMVLVHVDTVMVLTTSKTTTTRMLSVLTCRIDRIPRINLPVLKRAMAKLMRRHFNQIT
jgi:hypothetical protein